MNGRKQSFEEKWGRPILNGGYTQIPNYLIRNACALGLSRVEIPVLLSILSVGEGYATAKQIGGWVGLHKLTVRKCFRTLEIKKFIRRIYVKGEGNRFDTRGTVIAVQNLIRKQQGGITKSYIGIEPVTSTDITKSNTNKEKDKNSKEEIRFRSFRKEWDEIKRKKGVQ